MVKCDDLYLFRCRLLKDTAEEVANKVVVTLKAYVYHTQKGTKMSTRNSKGDRAAKKDSAVLTYGFRYNHIPGVCLFVVPIRRITATSVQPKFKKIYL